MYSAKPWGSVPFATALALAALALAWSATGPVRGQTAEPPTVQFEGPELPPAETALDDSIIVVSDEVGAPPEPAAQPQPAAPSSGVRTQSGEVPRSAVGAVSPLDAPPVIVSDDAPPEPLAQGESKTATPSRVAAPAAADDRTKTNKPLVFTNPKAIAKPTEEEPLKLEDVFAPVAAAAGPHPEDLPTEAQPAKFQGIQPGVSTLEDAVAAIGEPTVVQQHNESTATLTFQVEAFAEVKVLFNHEIVNSVVVEMGQALDPKSLLTQLGLDAYRPVVIRDDVGRPLGIAVPERGVLLTLSPDDEKVSVRQVVLEPIDPQTFVARVQSDLFGPISSNMSDLVKALELSPKDPAIHYLRSELFLHVGRADDAMDAALRAIELDTNQPQYRLAYARALAAADRHVEAIRETQRVLEWLDLPPVVRAAGFAQLGDLLLEGPRRDVDDAMKLHQAALKLAVPLAANVDSPDRPMALGVVIDSHLAIAQDIALGNWRNKPQSIDGWTRRAAQFAQQAIEQDEAGTELVLSVSRAALAAHASLRGATDGMAWMQDATRSGQRLLEKETDPLKQIDIRWQLALCNYHAVRIAHARGEVTKAQEYGQEAVEQMHQIAKLRELTGPQTHLLGRLFFQIGAVYAVHQQDHREAARWYDKSLELLKAPTAVSLLSQPSDDGEAMVSMGVTFWELGRHNEAVAVTEQGAALMAQAVRQGAIPEQSLAAPYGNLASMFRQQGDLEQAKNYAELAQKPAAAVR